MIKSLLENVVLLPHRTIFQPFWLIEALTTLHNTYVINYWLLLYHDQKSNMDSSLYLINKTQFLNTHDSPRKLTSVFQDNEFSNADLKLE